MCGKGSVRKHLLYTDLPQHDNQQVKLFNVMWANKHVGQVFPVAVAPIKRTMCPDKLQELLKNGPRKVTMSLPNWGSSDLAGKHILEETHTYLNLYEMRI